MVETFNNLMLGFSIALQPQSPPSELIAVDPRQATRLCGRPLDWIEVARRITP